MISALHGDVSVQIEQSGEHPPTIALSVDVPDPRPHAAGFTLSSHSPRHATYATR